MVAKSSEQVVRSSCVSLGFHNSFASLDIDMTLLSDQQDLLSLDYAAYVACLSIMHITP